MTTYDPIIEIRALPAIRLLSPVRPPEPGRALVLVARSGAPYTVHHGGTVPSAWVGTYQSAYLVDVTEHWLNLEVPLISRDPSFAFRAAVGLLAAVNDPVEIISRGIRDVGRALRDPTKWLLRQVSRDYDIAQFHEAERALNAAVRGYTGDSAIRLRDVTVELLVDDDEVVASGRAYRESERDSRLSDRRRDRHLMMLRRDGVEGLLAEILEKEGPRAALEWIAAAEGAERDELMRALDTLLKHSEPEPFEAVEAQRAVLKRLMEGSSAPFGGTRPGRVRGTIPAAPAVSARAELEAGPYDDHRDDGAGHSREGHGVTGHGVTGYGEAGHGYGGSSTVHGAVYGERPVDRPAEPPEDEPDGGTVTPGGSGGAAPAGARRASRVRGARTADSADEDRPR